MQVKCCPAHVLAARIGISRSIVVDQLGAMEIKAEPEWPGAYVKWVATMMHYLRRSHIPDLCTVTHMWLPQLWAVALVHGQYWPSLSNDECTNASQTAVGCYDSCLLLLRSQWCTHILKRAAMHHALPQQNRILSQQHCCEQRPQVLPFRHDKARQINH